MYHKRALCIQSNIKFRIAIKNQCDDALRDVRVANAAAERARAEAVAAKAELKKTLDTLAPQQQQSLKSAQDNQAEIAAGIAAHRPVIGMTKEQVSKALDCDSPTKLSEGGGGQILEWPVYGKHQYDAGGRVAESTVLVGKYVCQFKGEVMISFDYVRQ